MKLDATFPQSLLYHLNQVAVDPRQQLLSQFDHGDPTSETCIDGAELQADVTPADD
jgi:hypothetical protein